MITRIPLYLHAGFHKTGTTAIQHWAASNRERLRQRGVLYPDYKPLFARTTDGHHFFAHAVAEKSKQLTVGQAADFASQWLDQARQAQSRVLLSAEPVCRHYLAGNPRGWREARLRYLQRLAEMLSGFEVRPILVLRRQDDFVRSLYQERVARSSIDSDFESFHGTEEPKARFLEVLRLFREVFGPVRVLIYEDLIRTGLVSSFFSELEIEGLTFSDRQVVRGSLSVGETLIKARLNPYVKKKRQNMKLIRWLKSWRVRWSLRGTFTGNESLWCSPAERIEYLASFRDENRLIGEEFLDGRRLLFPELRDEAEAGKRHIEPAEIDDVVRKLVRGSARQLTGILGPRIIDELGV